jgi:hypothetical protein
LPGFDFDGFADGCAGDAGRAGSAATSVANACRCDDARTAGLAAFDRVVAATAAVGAGLGAGSEMSGRVGGETLGGAMDVSAAPVLKMGAAFWAVAPKARTTTTELPTTISETYSGRRFGGIRCALMPVSAPACSLACRRLIVAFP